LHTAPSRARSSCCESTTGGLHSGCHDERCAFMYACILAKISCSVHAA
jgi:hypothetical protein